MTVKLLAPDKETHERMMKGCAHYKLEAKYNRRTKPYVHVQIETEEQATNLFWLGANLAIPVIKNHWLYQSSF